ncbi:MAG: ABC transporter permease [Chlamydiales bacterium]|nr:ABC transporter permease [Chlamydiales bacterium]
MKRILSLIIKELIFLWRDKKTRFILIFPPLWQLCIFSFAATLDVKNVTIGILNRDNGEKGFELVERIQGSPIFTHVILLPSVESITPFINEQIGPVVLSIDEQFSRLFDSKLSPSLQLILDGRKSNTAQIIAGYVNTIINQFAKELSFREKIPTQPTALVLRYWFNPNLLYDWFTVPGLLVILTMVEALLITCLSIARERELGTFDQLLVSPLTPSEILIGKTIPSILASLLEGLFLFLVVLLFFNIPFVGSFFLLLLSMLIYTAAITGVGLFISSLCATQQQAILGAFIFLTPAVLLSGFATPIENMPVWLQYATYLNPTRYFMYISRGLFLKDLRTHTIFQHLWPLCLIAIFNLTAAAHFFRRRFVS